MTLTAWLPLPISTASGRCSFPWGCRPDKQSIMGDPVRLLTVGAVRVLTHYYWKKGPTRQRQFSFMLLQTLSCGPVFSINVSWPVEPHRRPAHSIGPSFSTKLVIISDMLTVELLCQNITNLLLKWEPKGMSVWSTRKHSWNDTWWADVNDSVLSARIIPWVLPNSGGL